MSVVSKSLRINAGWLSGKWKCAACGHYYDECIEYECQCSDKGKVIKNV